MHKKLLMFLLLLTIVINSGYADEGNGSIYGKVIVLETGEPISKANVAIENTDIRVETDMDGIYKIANVPVGRFRLAVSKQGYVTLVISDVEVLANRSTEINAALKFGDVTTGVGLKEAQSFSNVHLGSVEVTAKKSMSTVAGLIANQRKSPTIVSSIASEQIKRSPDANAADALKRVTGLTVVNDRYVYVRGLSERYSNTRLNNSSLSSPEADKWIVPLDIFPAGLLDNIVVTKTFTPELPGDYTGGSIQLSTKDFSESFTAKLTTSFSYETGVTFNDIKTYEGGRFDFLGYDDGTRALPENLKNASKNRKVIEGGIFGGGFTEQELEQFGESFSNIWTPYSKTTFLNQGYSFSLGNQVKFLNRPLGFITALTYKNSNSIDDKNQYYYIKGANDELEVRHYYQDYKISKSEVILGGIFNTTWKISPTNKISLRTMFNRISDDQVRQYSILPNRDHNADEKSITLQWVERSLLSIQLSGERMMSFLGSELNWQIGYSWANRNEPDRREILYESEIDKENYRLADESQSGSRFFSILNDNTFDADISLSIPLEQWLSRQGKLKFGGNFIVKDRNIDSRRFRFKPQSNHGINIYQDIEDILTPENISPTGFQLEEDTRSTDNYKGEQIIDSGYVMIDTPIISKLRLVTGARIEFSDQKVTTFDLFNPNAEPIIGQVKTTDIMPAANFTYSLTDNMNVRAAASQTISRPSFRELSKFEFTDIGGRAIVGNPNLKRALIQNYDLRWEWYTGITEYLTFTIFYKRFKDPIEKTLKITSAELTSSWQNAKSAYNYRAELEMRENFKFINPSLYRLILTGNFALIKSKVTLYPGGYETSKERALQGQSPYVINLMMTYIIPKSETDISVLYNRFGRRISEVGVAGTPDIYEEPYDRIDLVLSQHLTNKISVKLSAKNILDPEIKFTQGRKTQEAFRENRTFSLEASYSW
ncbi:MAG: TonB-dependent receptor domain-containing protein [bacterium]